MAKTKLTLDKLNPDGLVASATTIKTSMTGNANFTTPNPTLAAIGTATTTLQTKINAYNTALTAVDTALADRDAATLALRNLLTQLAAYVDNVTGGDATKIASSGMGLRNGNSSIGPLAQVIGLALTPGNDDGKLDAAWKATRGAASYEVQTSVDPVTVTSWAHALTAGKSSASLEDLTSGTKQWVRVRAVGANNQTGGWSDPAAKTVP